MNEHSRSLYRYSLRRLSDWSSCEDVVSETFLTAWRKRDQIPPRDRELAWLYGITFRVLSNQRRSRDRRDRLNSRLALERADGNSAADDDSVDIEPVLRAIRGLRESDRSILEHVYWERLAYREIAIVLGISENAVGIRINRAKKHLRTLLEGDEASGIWIAGIVGEAEA
ncbi:MAG: RNA polymerase sigma factor [Acidimicrobiales bacterium]